MTLNLEARKLNKSKIKVKIQYLFPIIFNQKVK